MKRISSMLIACSLALGTSAQSNMTGLLEHPCLLLSAQTLPTVRNNCTTQEPNVWGVDTAQQAQRLLSLAESFLATPYRYQANFPATTDQSAVTWQYELSDQTPPPHPDHPQYAVWTGMFREAPDSISTRLTHLSFAYVVTGERKYAEAAKSIALNLANWQAWTDPSYASGAHLAWVDTGLATKSVAICYDWCFQTLSAADRARIQQALTEKGVLPLIAQLRRSEPGAEERAALATGLVCAALALRPETPQAGEWLNQGIEALRALLEVGGTDGGVFAGPGRGTTVMDALADPLYALTVAQVQTDLFDHPTWAHLPEYCAALLSPDGKVVADFGDAAAAAGFPRTMILQALRGSTAAGWYLQQAGLMAASTLFDLLRFDGERMVAQPPEFELSRPFVDVGCTVLRGTHRHAPCLWFKCGPPEREVVENHFDQNSFQLHYLGEFLIADRGPGHRFLPAKTRFTRGTLGHSSLVLDLTQEYLADTLLPHPGHDQVNRVGGRIEQFFTSPVLDYVQGQAAAAYNSQALQVVDDYTRSIVYLKPWIYVLLDRVRTPALHSYHLCLQVPGEAQVEHAHPVWRIFGRRARLDCWFASSVPISTAAHRCPGAEEYGEFLTVSTSPQTAAEFLTLLYPRTHHGTSLLSNPGFEGSHEHWIIRGGEDEPNHAIDYQVKRTGQSSARVDRSGYYYSQRFPVKPGDRVRASVWMKTKGAGQGGVLVLYWWAGPSIGSRTSARRTAEDDWVRLEVEGIAPEGAQEVCMACTFHDTGQVWFDDADIWVETSEEVLPAPRPEPTGLVMAPKARGVGLSLGERRLGLALGGAPVDLGQYSLATDGTLVCLGFATDLQFLYLQEGTVCSYDDVPVLRTDRPLTVCLWRGEDGIVQVRAQQSIAPHAPRLASSQVHLTVRSDAPITQAVCEGAPMRVTDNGDGSYTLGGG